MVHCRSRYQNLNLQERSMTTISEKLYITKDFKLKYKKIFQIFNNTKDFIRFEVFLLQFTAIQKFSLSKLWVLSSSG